MATCICFEFWFTRLSVLCVLLVRVPISTFRFGGQWAKENHYNFVMCSSRKYPYSPAPRRDWNFLGVGGSVRPKNVQICMKLTWNFQRGGVFREKSLPWGKDGYFLELHNQPHILLKRDWKPTSCAFDI